MGKYKRVCIDSLLVSSGPVPSLVVLKSTTTSPEKQENPALKDDLVIKKTDDPCAYVDRLQADILPIRIGSTEASELGMGIETPENHHMPMTHDLLLNVIDSFGAKLEDVFIDTVKDQQFVARLMIDMRGTADDYIPVTCRVSDALCLAVRQKCCVWASQEVLNKACWPNFDYIRYEEEKGQYEAFQKLLEKAEPDDFA